ncbi:orotidine 5'-phosphate decarboxylase [Candidatus Uhrbacteria bacterium]|nr:orotidine 5'-phosphate decarboxylase [Candidatus Uhrbacteria bacterium]
MSLSKKLHYLQIALNSNLDDAASIIASVPRDPRIIFEAGTPLIKEFGAHSIAELRAWAGPDAYIVADMKTMDRGATEVSIAGRYGANGVIALGLAPIETLNAFVAACDAQGLDAMIDMMNVEYALTILRALKKPPRVVLLHRGVDEERDNREKQIPFHEIARVKGAYDILLSIAGGDTIKDVQRAFFNSADIAVVWKSFYSASGDTASLAQEFLKEIR